MMTALPLVYRTEYWNIGPLAKFTGSRSQENTTLPSTTLYSKFVGGASGSTVENQQMMVNKPWPCNQPVCICLLDREIFIVKRRIIKMLSSVTCLLKC